MSDYVLLLRGGARPGRTGDELSPDGLQAYIAPYQAWLNDLAQSGKLLHAHRLLDDGAKVVVRADTSAVTVLDGPYTESKDVIGGFYLVRAESEADALTIAGECPHLANGGSVELRRVAD